MEGTECHSPAAAPLNPQDDVGHRKPYHSSCSRVPPAPRGWSRQGAGMGSSIGTIFQLQHTQGSPRAGLCAAPAQGLRG